MSSRGAGIIGAALLLLALPDRSRAQDLEFPGSRASRQPPPGYLARVDGDPSFFELRRGWIARVATASQLGLAVEGELPLLVVQALFSDSPEPHIASSEIQKLLFDGPATYGTLTEFYREMSRGKFTVTGSVLPWIRTTLRLSSLTGWTPAQGGESPFRTYLIQALTAADELVDLTQYDNDGPDGIPNSGDDDGYVDALAFQYIETSAACGGTGPWPHKARISGAYSPTPGPYVSADIGFNGQPILVDDYIIQSTLGCDGVTPQTASVIGHELGHVLGLPDLYHAVLGILPSQRRWVLGCWTLMAAGAWGCGDGSTFSTAKRPSHMGPWEKSVLGWITEETVHSVRDQEFILDPVQTSGRSLRVPLSLTEYFQIEYRPRIGFDSDLPASGVLVYRVDLERPFNPPANAPRLYRVSMAEADGDEALLRTSAEGGNRGVGGDAWGLGGRTHFSNVTQPSAKRNSGTPSTFTIHDIRFENGQAVIRLTTAETPAIIAERVSGGIALRPMDADIRVAGGALPYSAFSLSPLPDGVNLSATGERIVFLGTALTSGTFAVQLKLVDALGSTIDHATELSIAPADIATERAVQPFTRSAAETLTTQERSYLDNTGNRNGRYDVGDLRRYLRSRAATAAAALPQDVPAP